MQITGDGDCLFEALLTQRKFKTDVQKSRYKPMYLRRQALWHFIDNRDEFAEMVVRGIKDEYGLVEDEENEERLDHFQYLGG